MVNELLNIIDRFIKIKEYRNQKVQKTYEQLLEPVFNDLMLIHNDYIKMFEKVLGLLRSYQIPFDKKGKTFTSKEFNKIFFQERLEHALEYLHAKRIEFEPIRISLRHLLKEIGSYNIKKLKDDKNIETHKLDRKYSISSEADEFIDAAIYYICDFETSKSFSTKIEGTKRKLILSSPSSYLEQKLFDIKHYLPFSIESDEVAWQTSFEDSMALHCNIDLEELIDREINNLRLKWSLVCESFVKLKIKVILKSNI